MSATSAYQESGNSDGSIPGDHNQQSTREVISPDGLLAEMEATWSTLRQAHNRRIHYDPVIQYHPVHGERVSFKTPDSECCERIEGAWAPTPTTAQDVLDAMGTSVPRLLDALNHEETVATQAWHTAQDQAGFPRTNLPHAEIVDAERSWQRFAQCASLLNAQLGTQSHLELLKELEAELGMDGDSDDEEMPALMDAEAEFDWQLIPHADPKAGAVLPSSGHLGDLD
ncbi:hypothetical protein C8R45DRAFT_1097479 [Mycena sanguinolenta]|nr:hypothetical protein C8R45DRAFT_1097479 [Mycena sanguinolenta]